MTLYLLLTNKCPFECMSCLNHSGPTAQNGLPTSTVKQIIDWLADQESPVIEFSGGEPLLREDFEELVQYCQERDIALTLSTNCWSINESHFPLLKLFRRITMTFYGTEEFHDSITNVPGSFRNNFRVLKRLNKFNNRIKANVVTMSEALPGYPLLIKKLTDSRISEIKFSMMLPFGRAVKLSSQLLTQQDFENLKNLSISLKNNRVPVVFQHLQNEPFNCRIMNKEELYISYDGRIRICALLIKTRFCTGEIFEDQNAYEILSQFSWDHALAQFHSSGRSRCPALENGIYSRLLNVKIINGCPPLIKRLD